METSMGGALRHGTGNRRASVLVDRVNWRTLGEKVRAQQRNREIYTPPISLYRWWARRSHALIGALLDTAVTGYDNSDFLISDPLSGGGTVAVEAALRGCRVYAQDLHPWAAWGLATALDGANPDELKRASDELLEATLDLRTDAYSSECSQHGTSEILHSFWVRECLCDRCERSFFLYPYTLLTKASRSRTELWGFFGCSACGHVGRQRLDVDDKQCDVCQYSLPDADTSLTAGRSVQCPHCSFGMLINDSIMVQWHLPLVQRICSTERGKTIMHFDSPDAADLAKARSGREPLPESLAERIPNGLETKVLQRMGFQHWSDLYPPRQLRCLLEAAETALELPVTDHIQDRLLLAIVGAAEMAGYLCRWDRYNPKAFEAMANHRFSPIGLGVEVNVLNSRGRGTLPKRLDASIKAARWAQRRLGDNASAATLTESSRRRVPRPPARPLVVSGSSERQLLPAKSVDLVLTDPPYFDSVQYGELSYPFYAWARAVHAPAGALKLDLRQEAVPNDTRGTGLEEYKTLLERIFAESVRTLKPDGRVILTFHSTDIRAWHALAAALAVAPLEIVGLAVCSSENEADHAKRGTRAFTKDLIIECQVRGPERSTQATVATQPQDEQDLELVSAGLAMVACGDKEFEEFKHDFVERVGSFTRRRIS